MTKNAKANRKGDHTDDRVRELTDKLEEGIRGLFESGKYREYLKFLGHFHNYSANNALLIMLQRPDASLVAGFRAWEGMDRHVMKGEKAISILAPIQRTKAVYIDKTDPETGEVQRDENGEPVKVRQEVTYTGFRPAYVFDVAQTDGKAIPSISDELKGNVAGFAGFMEGIREAAPAPIGFEDIAGGANGYYSPTEDRIAVQEGMSELQTVKTALHETAHSILHRRTGPKADRETAEVEAESVAYVVCQYFGLDSSDYSFGYIAGWSSGKDLPELQASLSTIQKTAHSLITDIRRSMEGHINNIDTALSAEKTDEKEREVPTVSAVTEEKAVPAKCDTKEKLEKHRRRGR